jgi:phage terminase small subunit
MIVELRDEAVTLEVLLALAEVDGANSQGKVAHPALGVEERAWREVRQLAGSILPMSPPSRASLGGTVTEDAGDDMERELGPARRAVVGDA